MKSMIIVDDNKLERIGIRNLIDWHALGINPIGLFRSGQHALDIMDELRPEIVLTDIQMPIMNGIELTVQLKALYPDVTVVFMSSYQQFEYAKSALRLGVEEYILKPVIAKEMQDTFRKIMDKLHMQEQLEEEKSAILLQLQEAMPLYREQFFKEFLFAGASGEAETREQMQRLQIGVPPNASFCISLLELNDQTDTAEEPDMPLSFSASYSIKKFIHSVSTPQLSLFPIQLTDTSYAFVVITDGRRHGEEELVNIFMDLQGRLAEWSGREASVGISSIVGHLTKVPGLYKQALRALKMIYSPDNKRPVVYGDIDGRQSPAEEIIDFQKLYNRMKQVIYGDFERALDVLSAEFFDGVPFHTEEYMHDLRISILNITQHILGDTHRPFDEIEPVLADLLQPFKPSTFKDWMRKVLHAAKSQLLHQHKSQYDQIVEHIKAIVESRLHEQITLQDVANAIYLSPSHMNNIFKAKMGKTVFDYLIECRMEAAKRKLLQPSSRIYLVAQEVGYTNKSHFCLIFKKYTGLTPTEFKQRPPLG